MVKKLAIYFLVLALIALLVPAEVLAVKARTSRGAGATVSSGASGSGRVISSVRFKANRLGVILSLSGLNNANSVTYELTYTATGIPQGARGTVSGSGLPAGKAGNTATRELLFGTCSKNVCRYHTNITNGRLTVTSKLKSGLTTRKTFRLKI